MRATGGKDSGSFSGEWHDLGLYLAEFSSMARL